MSLYQDFQATAVAAADLAIAPLLDGHRTVDRMQIAQIAVDAARPFLQKAMWNEGLADRTGPPEDDAAPA